MREIIIENATENNLKNVSLRIPHYQLIVVTGVSGSGKTSLVYDVLCAEGQRLFYENFNSGRNVTVKLTRPGASRIEGLFPVISIGQNNMVRSPRSTVGTLTGIYDHLRLLFARLGKTTEPGVKLNRSLFSFNLPEGWCPVCKGLGVQDHIDPSLLIADETKSIRQGAFVLTTPNNYIVYSQVTMDVLDQVCRAEGFHVDIPWKELTNEQKDVVLNGSRKIKVLFGKHPLESRLKWTGITAKPREEDYYKGIVPVMEDILRRDRNANIMRFARSHRCESCYGKRLNQNALSVALWGKDIAAYAAMSIAGIHHFFAELSTTGYLNSVVEPVRDTILKRTGILLKLGAGHLTLNRESLSLSTGEAQRIKLANQVNAGLRNVLYILDEPSVGLHSSEQRDLLEVLRSLVSAGNTVLMVDHDEQSIREADWIVDIGPGAGESGGSILYNGPARQFFDQPQPNSITYKFLHQKKYYPQQLSDKVKYDFFKIEEADKNNLKRISPQFLLKGLNVITGVSGSGKTSLVQFLLEKTLNKKNGGTDIFRKVIHIDASPIGRTPSSNPATYTGISDHIRDLLASLPESHQKKFKKGQFSFVVKGGRCESCGGAGVQQIGMHFLGNVDVVCEVCNGKRFTDETLAIRYNGLNIYEILNLTVDEANRFFDGQKKITAITQVLSELGLGYLKLGQPSTTLSGGEAQRVKLASELSRPASGTTLYILDEPTTGLHMADVEVLLMALKKLVEKGNTLICIEHDPSLILQADWMVDLGPGSAAEGGRIVVQGFVADMKEFPASKTVSELNMYLSAGESGKIVKEKPISPHRTEDPIVLREVETNNLKKIDISFPVNVITAITGVSGSGKSSLVYGSLFAESQQRFFEGMPSAFRQSSAKVGIPVMGECEGLIPAISLQKKNAVKNPRSTLATFTGLYDVYRLMFSRLAKSVNGKNKPLSSAFSFNSEQGACPVCKGLGSHMVCDEVKLITSPHKSLLSGAMDGTKTGRFYGDPYGQYVATLRAVGEKYGVDFNLPFHELNDQARELAMKGCGDQVFDVHWEYKRGAHEGVHQHSSQWPGLFNLVEDEYLRKHNDARADSLTGLMKNIPCRHCQGYRLSPEILGYTINGLHIGQLTAMTSDEALNWFELGFLEGFDDKLEIQAALSLKEIIMEYLSALQKAGLGYISTDRIVGTLSGGEFQRLQLAGLARAPLTGVAYILDEPSFGLHPKDVLKINELIVNLHKNGNTVIIVDHSPILIKNSQYIIELGPGAGSRGGQVMFSGKTNDYLDTPTLENKQILRVGTPGKGIVVKKAYANNLCHIDIEIPSGVLTAITGVSGSGKSSLLDKVIFESFSCQRPVFCDEFSGSGNFSSLIYIGQSLPSVGQFATVGIKLGISGIIANIFAAQDESKNRGFKAAHFLPGSREGRCPSCEGTGFSQVAMDYYNDAVFACETCNGMAYKEDVLDVKIEGKTIADFMQITFDELFIFLETQTFSKLNNSMKRTLELVQKTGLGHLSCGRLIRTLSGGERQRLKLVTGLSSSADNHSLILLDEPTGGLHFRDIEKLLMLFKQLIEEGNTLICVTHEPLLMAAASKIIELGPGGGAFGGRIVSEDYPVTCV